jgi:hypothetical protein
VDKSHHHEIVNLMNVAGSAQDERQNLLANDNLLLTATKAEIVALNIQTSAIEKSLEEMVPYLKRLGGKVFRDFIDVENVVA